MERQTMVSQRDIAKAVGVSVATVSTVLSNKSEAIGISPKTAARVEQEAKRLNYHRNLTARGLRTSRHYAIGLLFFNPSELLYGELLAELQDCLTAHHYAGVCAFWHTEQEVASAFESVVSRGVDGIITCHDGRALVPKGLAAVAFEARFTEWDSVVRDRDAAIQRGLNYLFSLGHRRIGMVNMNRREHEACVCAEFRQAGVEADPKWVGDDSINYLDESKRALKRLLSKPPTTRPTALMCRNDTVAMLAMSMAGRMGLHIPGDLSVLGFDNVAIGEMSNPPLTTLGTPIRELARHLVALMMRRLETPDAPVKWVQLKKRLIVRDSCAPPRVLNEMTS